MKSVKLLFALVLLTGIGIPCAQDAEVFEKAPEFSMYQYEDKVFDTDSVYGKKIVTFIFGSLS